MILFINRIRCVLYCDNKKLLNITCNYINTRYLTTSFNFYKNTREKLYKQGKQNYYKGIQMTELPRYKPPPVQTLKRIKYRNTVDRPPVPVPKIDIQIIGCGSNGSPRAVCLSTTTTKLLNTLFYNNLHIKLFHSM